MREKERFLTTDVSLLNCAKTDVIRLKMNAIHDLNGGLVHEGDNLFRRRDDGHTTHAATADIGQHFQPQHTK